MITLQALFYGAYREVKLIENEQDQLGPDQEEECRQVYNRWVDQMQAEGLLISHIKRTLFPLTANVGTYTIGPGGTWNTVWPERLERMSLILVNGTEYSLFPLTDDEWQQWINKSQTSSQPRRFHYERSFPLGKIHLLYVPSDSLQVAIYEEVPLVQFEIPAGTPPDFSTVEVEYPPGYQAMLELGLALQVGNRNSKATITDDLRTAFKRALEIVITPNNRPLARESGMFTTRGSSRSDVLNGNRYGW